MAKILRKQPEVESPSALRPEALRFKVSWGIVFAMVVLPVVLLLGAGFFGFWMRNNNQTAVPSAKVSVAKEPSQTLASRAGPWGMLEAQPTVLQIPDESLKGGGPIANPRWVFKGYSKARVLQLFASAGLGEDDLRSLNDPNLWQVQPHQAVLTPPRALLFALTPMERSIIYTALAQFSENPMQHSPFFWKTKDEAELLAHPGISDQAKVLIQRLSYPKGNLSVFADLEILSQLSATEKDLAKVLKQLSSKPTVLAKLNITPETDLSAMMRYWGVAGLSKIMQPALEAVTRIPQGRTVTFLAVLPPFARERMNTYPGGETDNDGMDGFWTAFNFFNERPEPAKSDVAAWKGKLNSDYFSVFTDPRYGDILIVSRPTGEVVQAAVYLADDLVFTRLGPTRWEPWCIMTVADLLEVSGIRLAHQETPTVSYHRNQIF